LAETRNRTVPLVALVVLALLAVADGAWLTMVHLDYETGINTVASTCHSLSDKGCLVTAGRFGAVMGVPVATIGAAGGFAILVLAIGALRKRAAHEDPQRSLLLLLTAFSVAVTILMATLSTIEGSFCPFCVAWYVLNLGMFVAAWMARNRGHRFMDLVDDATGNTGFVALGAFVLALVLGVWMHNRELGRRQAEEEQVLQEKGPEIAASILEKNGTLKQPPRQVAVKGSPSKGPEDAAITIVEFGDFECPHCQKLWNSLEEYYRTTDRKVRVVFANFPLNDACNPVANDLHPHACAAAVAGVCAQRQNRFWEYGQVLFDNQKALETENLVNYARDVDMDIAQFQSCLDDPSAMVQVKYDIGLAMKLDVKATPTFFVNGYAVTGAFPVPLLAAIIDQIAAHEQAATP
jgi:protein-disulfide isomerase/uncharacterized membrane protein